MSAMAEVIGKQADLETLQEVDLMILDYLLYQTTQTVIADRMRLQGLDTPSSATSLEADLPLSTFDNFLQLYKRIHSRHLTSSPVTFRLRLAKFTTLFGRRLFRSFTTPSPIKLQQLRERNGARATTWLLHQSNVSGIPSPEDPVLVQFIQSLPLNEYPRARNIKLHLEKCNLAPLSDHYGLPLSVSLLDLLPLFMTLSANVANTGGDMAITPLWIEVAVEFMLLAALEQYRIYGAQGPDALREAFAWGFDELSEDEEGSDDWKVNEMFLKSGTKMMKMWRTTKDVYLKALIPHETEKLENHLGKLAREFPLHHFDTKVINMLQDFSGLFGIPDLVQFESGQIGSLTEEETTAVRQRVGLL